jgi:predicted nuclease of predicted toxin-antitoxin system
MNFLNLAIFVGKKWKKIVQIQEKNVNNKNIAKNLKSQISKNYGYS